jgi:hypothetical protein
MMGKDFPCVPFVGATGAYGPEPPQNIGGKVDAGTDSAGITQDYLFGPAKPSTEAESEKKEETIFAPIENFSSSPRFKQIIKEIRTAEYSAKVLSSLDFSWMQ